MTNGQKLRNRLSEPISAITAYDYPSARLADEAGIQLLLVGDSLGMVVAGNPDTTTVTLDHMVYHTEMVRRGTKNAVLVSDLPIHTYDTPEKALASARRLLEAGADAVKLEGGLNQVEKLTLFTREDIAFMGHIGMLPQRVKEEGGYKKKGRKEEEADLLIESARALEDAGAFAIVLESIVPEVAGRITRSLGIPTISVGAGYECTGQIRVLHDVIGAYPWFVPPFATVHGDVAGEMKRAFEKYARELR